MQTTIESLMEGFLLDKETNTFVFHFGGDYELAFEPLLFDNQMYVALYKNKDLLTSKVVVKPGKV